MADIIFSKWGDAHCLNRPPILQFQRAGWQPGWSDPAFCTFPTVSRLSSGLNCGRAPLWAGGRLALRMARDVFHRDSATAARRTSAPQLARDVALRRTQTQASP